MHHVQLKFVQKKVQGHGGRATNAGLSLTSMIDFLIVVVVFLLMTFSASGDIPTPEGLRLPKAENTLDMIEAPLVSVMKNTILVDGKATGSTRSIEENNKLQRVEELFTVLKAKRELWTQLHPGKPFPGVVVLQIDQQVKAVVVKSVFQTAAYAGFPNVSFMVGNIPKSGGGKE
jgi:biopolymer transport protein ExbD